MTKKTKKTTAVATKEKAGAVVDAALLKKYGNLGEHDDIQARDLICPKVLLVQSQSKAFVDRKAEMGDYMDSLTEEVLIPAGEAVEFIVLKSWRTWTVFENTGKGQPKYVATEDFTVRPDRPQEESVQGALRQNFETHNYYVILPHQLKEDSDGVLPYALSFRSTGLMASKTIKTVAMKAKMKGTNIPICFNVFTLGSEFVENELGKFYKPTVKKVRMATEEELGYVQQFVNLVNEANVKIDNSDLEQEAGADVGVPPPSSADAPSIEV